MIYNVKVATKSWLKSLPLLGLIILCSGLFTVGNAATDETLLFPQIKSWDLKTLKITDRNNKILEFKRKMCVWTLGQESLPTDEARVANFADQIIGLTYQKFIGAQKTKIPKDNVSTDNFSYKIEIGLPENRSETIYLKSTDESNSIYVQIAGNENLYIINNNSILANISMENEFWLPSLDSKEE